MTYSVIIPVYKNEEALPELISALEVVQTVVQTRFGMPLEVVFVVDGSPDQSFSVLEALLPTATFRSLLLLHARNFGSFAAIRTGLGAATGSYFSMIAADLQEPPELLSAFLEKLVDDTADIVVGVRESRDDPALSKMSANLFWRIYRALVIKEIPEGGVDLFACTLPVRNELLKLGEAHSSLIGLVYWVGFRRAEVSYHRTARKYGSSAWTFRKKFDYLLDSIFAFTDIPIRILTVVGLLGVVVTSLMGIMVASARILGFITVSGYATTILMIMFFGTLNTLGIGLVGHYAWRTYENTKQRSLGIVRCVRSFCSVDAAPSVKIKG